MAAYAEPAGRRASTALAASPPALPLINPRSARSGGSPGGSPAQGLRRVFGRGHGFIDEQALVPTVEEVGFLATVRLLGCLLLHFFSLVSQLVAMYFCFTKLQLQHPTNITITLITVVTWVISAIFCCSATWTFSARICGGVMPLKSANKCLVLPMLLLLGVFQGVIVVLALDEFFARREAAEEAEGRGLRPPQISSKFHVKALLGLVEGLVTATVLSYFTVMQGRGLDLNCGPLDRRWLATLWICAAVSFFSAGQGLLELDFCVSWAISRRMLNSWWGGLYCAMHWLFRTSEISFRVLLYFVFTAVVRSSGKDHFWATWFWLPAAVEFLITLCIVYIYGGAESWWVRFICCLPAMYANVFEFIDSPYKRRGARRVSLCLAVRNLVSVAALISLAYHSNPHGVSTLLSEPWYIPFCNDPHIPFCKEHGLGTNSLTVQFIRPLFVIWLVSLLFVWISKCGNVDLYSACERGDPQGVQSAMMGLVDSAAVRLNVNSPDIDGKTPLMLAAARGHVHVCKHLLKEGARVDIRIVKDSRVLVRWIRRPVRNQWTALHIGARAGHLEVVRALMGMPGVPADAREEWANAVQAEVTRPVRTVHFQDQELETPLHVAVRAGHVAVAQLISQTCPEWREVSNKFHQKAVELARTDGMRRAVTGPWPEAEHNSVELGHDPPLMRQIGMATPTSPEIQQWPLFQLPISRILPEGGQFKAPGLCSFIAGSCGGALGRFFLVAERGHHRHGMHSLSTIMEISTPEETSSRVSSMVPPMSEGSNGSLVSGSLESLEPVDSTFTPVPEWVRMVELAYQAGTMPLGDRLSMVPRTAVLGRGSYGTVWRARDRNTHTLYAVKNVMTRRGSTALSKLAANEREISDSVRLKPHPCIVKLFGVHNFPNMDLYCLVMEFCPNGDILRRIRTARAESPPGTYQPPRLAHLWIGQIFLALEHMHRRMKTLLRDLKPENVVLGQGEYAKLTDFGLGRFGVESAGNFTFGFPPGSPGYIAPEILKQEQYDFRADLYSLGVLVWVLLTGGLLAYKDPVPPVGKGRSNKDFVAHYQDYRRIKECTEQPDAHGARALPSPEAKSLVLWLTKKRASGRPAHEELRQHDLFRPLNLPTFQSPFSAVEAWLATCANLAPGSSSSP